ncbi:hypothetical protein [Candidatus Nitrosotenuis cloacae]|uniref:hypothetical protein n=1 Tax=Candidatus Nitrosotenuis cloacae TaxID=1603555 RepID=UPI0022809549|nr:hypothetical protein [Candidatus Nitrosotenuis cloacae]
MEKYQKNLSRPEARHRYWHIHKDNREFFPETGKIFSLKFDGKVFDLKVNHKDDVMTGQLYERHRFLEGDLIIVTKNKYGTYSLEAPDTGLYPHMAQP